MKKIQFLQYHVLQNENRGTEKQTEYKPGDELLATDDSAHHWVSRGLAKEIAMENKKVASPLRKKKVMRQADK